MASLGDASRRLLWAAIVGCGAVAVLLPYRGVSLGSPSRLSRLVASVSTSYSPDHSHLPLQLQPFRPRSIRTINALGGLLGASNLVSIAPDALIASGCAAAEKAGLLNGSDCPLQRPNQCESPASGGSGAGAAGACWLEGLERVSRSLETEAQLTLLGRVVVLGHITDALKARAALQVAWEQTDPGEWNREIVAPIIIAGMPRTGTTFLHTLLSQDPSLRAPRTWELLNPVPRPPLTPEAVAEDAYAQARIAELASNLEQYKKLCPGLDAFHPTGATQPEECIIVFTHMMDSVQFEAMFPVPSYSEWMYELETHRPALEWHKKVLQWMQGPTEVQWLLKTPYYLHLLEDVREAYPDARIIHTHREPAEVLASTSSLMAKTYGAVTDTVDLHAIGQQQTETYAKVLPRVVEVRSRWEQTPPDPPVHIADVHLGELQQDPIGTVKRIYTELLGRELSEDAENRMRAFLKDHKRDKHGRHRHSPEDFGINITFDQRFEGYRRRFGVKPAMAHVAVEGARARQTAALKKSPSPDYVLFVDADGEADEVKLALPSGAGSVAFHECFDKAEPDAPCVGLMYRQLKEVIPEKAGGHGKGALISLLWGQLSAEYGVDARSPAAAPPS